jgi:hypothetical protein
MTVPLYNRKLCLIMSYVLGLDQSSLIIRFLNLDPIWIQALLNPDTDPDQGFMTKIWKIVVEKKNFDKTTPTRFYDKI